MGNHSGQTRLPAVPPGLEQLFLVLQPLALRPWKQQFDKTTSKSGKKRVKKAKSAQNNGKFHSIYASMRNEQTPSTDDDCVKWLKAPE